MNLDLNNRNFLKQKCEPWNFDTDTDSKLLEKFMISIMNENSGIGLAANQIGLNKRVFVIGGPTVNSLSRPIAVFNPIILESSEELILYEEGCLSYKDVWIKIKRPESIKVSFETSDKEIVVTQLNGLAARCFQHEYDHLEGVCFVDKVSKMKLNLALRKSRKNIR